eukprot:1161540-Pelagomonas_calceolata.AAC.13
MKTFDESIIVEDLHIIVLCIACNNISLSGTHECKMKKEQVKHLQVNLIGNVHTIQETESMLRMKRARYNAIKECLPACLLGYGGWLGSGGHIVKPQVLLRTNRPTEESKEGSINLPPWQC